MLQLTIEHDPNAVSRRRQTFLNPKQCLPLTTTASDTNIPNKKNKMLIDSSYFGSTESINIDLDADSQELRIVNKNKPTLSDNNSDKPTLNDNISDLRSVQNCGDDTVNKSPKSGVVTRSGDKERLFKRRDEGYMSGTRSRQLRRKNNTSETRQSLDKERSSSMSRLLDE